MRKNKQLCVSRIVAALVLLCGLPPAEAGAQTGPFELGGFVVTASPTPRARTAIASHVTLLDGGELRERGLVSVADALRDVPGLIVVRGGSFGATTSVFFRGAESDQVQVLVDGVPLNQPGGAVDLSVLTLEGVERIEVVRGTLSALYGSDAVAGVIHLVTRTGRGAPRVSLSARAGTFGRRDISADVAGGTDRVGYGLSYTRQTVDGLLAFNNRHTNQVLRGSVRLVPDARTRAELSLRLGERAYHFPTDGGGAIVDRNAFTFGDETSLGLMVSRRVRPSLSLRFRLSASELDGGTDDAPDGPADTLGFFGFRSLDHVRRTAAELSAHLELEGAVASVGAEFEDQSQRSFNESASQFGSSAGRSEYERWNRAYYAHLTADAGPLSLNGGARLEDNERYGTFMSWQAGAAWRLRAGTRLRLSAGRAVKEPTFLETFATGFARGNPDLDPERATSLEVGLEQTVGGLELQGTFFGQDLRDLIQFTFATPSPGAPNYFNVAEARVVGLELSAVARLGPASLRADWTWLDSEVRDAGFDEGPEASFVRGARLLRRPTHLAGLSVRGPLGGVAVLTAEVRFVGAREDRDFASFPARRTELDAHTTVGFGAEVGLGRSLTLTARIENLFDEAYEEVLGFPAPGRAAYVGARLSLGGGG